MGAASLAPCIGPPNSGSFTSYAVSFGPEHEDVKLPEFGGPMHGANEAAPIDKLLEAVKIYILALLRLEEIDF